MAPRDAIPPSRHRRCRKFPTVFNAPLRDDGHLILRAPSHPLKAPGSAIPAHVRQGVTSSRNARTRSMSQSIPRVPMGVPGLDEVLLGGLPAGHLYLVDGTPGVGKTTLALHFLLEGVRRGESCLYVTLSETKRELEAVALSHGWSLEGIR